MPTTVFDLKNSWASTKSRLRRNPWARLGTRSAIRLGEASHGRARDDVPGYLVVRPSTVKGAGDGVFAARTFLPGEAVLLVTGTLRLTKGQTRHEMRYSWVLPSPKYAQFTLQCASDGETNIAKYVNAASGAARVNVAIEWHGVLPMLVATRPIAAGDELFLDYEF